MRCSPFAGRLWMGRRFRIEGAAYLTGALAILLVPLNWLTAVVAAAAFHEGCHYLAARMLKVPIYGIRVCWGGCRMDTGPMERNQEILCAAAGPLGSLLLVFLIRWFPRLAICAAVQGTFNLLPLYPMDGGRIVRAAAGERAGNVISRFVGIVLLVGGGWMTIAANWGPVPLLLGVLTAVRNVNLKNFLQTGQTHSTIGLPIFKR